MNAWTRSEKIAALALGAAVVSTVCTAMMVPELRRLFRLRPSVAESEPKSTGDGTEALIAAAGNRYSGKIAFISNRSGGHSEIFAINADGTDLHSITKFSPADKYDGGVNTIAISLDGKQLAFSGGMSLTGRGDIWTINTDGSNLRNLTQGSGLNVYPQWSPDASRIAFLCQRDLKEYLCIMNADGSDFRTLARAQISYPGSAPAWAPSGRQIAFLDENGRVTIAVVAGSELSSTCKMLDSYSRYPVWKPDGSSVAFPANGDIYIGNADCSNVLNLTNDSSDHNWNLSWSPDGRRIAFDSQRDGETHIFAIDITTSEITKLTDDSAPDSEPSWSPDGTQIIFYRGVKEDNRYIMNKEVWIMFSDGTGQRNLSNNPAWDRLGQWFPQ